MQANSNKTLYMLTLTVHKKSMLRNSLFYTFSLGIKIRNLFRIAMKYLENFILYNPKISDM